MDVGGQRSLAGLTLTSSEHECALPIEVFSTCPSSATTYRDDYVHRVVDAARWSEEAGCTGILVYSDNGLVDPWLLAQMIVEHTTQLSPLVAVQPMYMHPYAVAKMVTSFAHLFGRRLHLNMIAGGFKNDLLALGDTTPHDRRYDRLAEYTQIISKLLDNQGAVTFKGEFYEIDKLSLKPALPKSLFPEIFVSGSSEAGLAAARAIGATAIQYPGPPEQCEVVSADDLRYGVRIGIVARRDADDAWRIAHERFPEDRKGQVTHLLAMKVSDSDWHKQLAETGAKAGENSDGDTYWLGPFRNYQTFCPYLVGDYEQTSAILARYLESGYRTYILDIPASGEELEHIGVVFRRAARIVSR